MKVSLIIPSRNNLKYLKWAYASIRKWYSNQEVEICVADDASIDDTWQWCEQISKLDDGFKSVRYTTDRRLGHTILYDRLIKEVATSPIVGIYHADMFLCPGSIEHVLQNIKPKTVISLTRIEPPLHPAGIEKVIADFGIEPEYFNEEKFLYWFQEHYLLEVRNKVTEGIFAPWFIFKEDFLQSGGHDILFAPQSKEDSDIFNRFMLQGFTFKQVWEGAVYHMTCRGSRFNPTLTSPGQSSDEWMIQNKISERNFIRKWGTVPLHDRFMKPIIPPKYNMGIYMKGSIKMLRALEPWASHIYLDPEMSSIIKEYILEEQSKTLYNLDTRVFTTLSDSFIRNGILVRVDESNFDQNDFIFLQQLPLVIDSILKKEDFTPPEKVSIEKGNV